MSEALLIAVVVIAILIVILARLGWLIEVGVSIFDKIKFSLKGRAPEERWRKVASFDVKPGEPGNEGEQWIPIRMWRTWRISYGAHPKPPEQGGHFTVRVYEDSWRLLRQLFRRNTVRRRKWHRVVADLRQPEITRSKEQIINWRGPVLVQVHAQTVWWTLTIEERLS